MQTLAIVVNLINEKKVQSGLWEIGEYSNEGITTMEDNAHCSEHAIPQSAELTLNEGE